MFIYSRAGVMGLRPGNRTRLWGKAAAPLERGEMEVGQIHPQPGVLKQCLRKRKVCG